MKSCAWGVILWKTLLRLRREAVSSKLKLGSAMLMASNA